MNELEDQVHPIISPSHAFYKSSHGSHLYFRARLCTVLFFSTISMNLLASLTSLSVVACAFIICFPSSLVQVEARQFDVGGRDGWVVHPAEDYNVWAGRYRFLINDTLVFKYKKGENSVLLVNKEGYDKCDTHNPIKKWDDGDTVFQLDRSGPFYFISGEDGNCQNGQKLVVVVLAFKSHPPPHPPPKALPPSAIAPGAAPGAKPPGSSTPVPSTSPATTPMLAPAMGPSSMSPSPTAAPGSKPPGSSTPATSPSPSTSPVATPTHAPAMGPSSPTAAPGSSTPTASPSPSTSPATTPAHAPSMGPSSLSPSPTTGSPSSAPTATAPASGPTTPGMPGASPPASSTTSQPPGGSENSSSPPPINSDAQVANPLGMWPLAFLMMVLGHCALFCCG